MTGDNDNNNKSGFASKFASKFQDIAKNNSSSSFADRFKSSKESKMMVDKISNKKSFDADLLFLVKGIDNNHPAWYYILVERLKLAMFKKSLNDDIIHLEEYGKILYSAYGDHPPKEITDKVKAEYGIDDSKDDDDS